MAIVVSVMHSHQRDDTSAVASPGLQVTSARDPVIPLWEAIDRTPPPKDETVKRVS